MGRSTNHIGKNEQRYIVFFVSWQLFFVVIAGIVVTGDMHLYTIFFSPVQKMGWKEGLGLGKANQGRTEIIEAEARSNSAGMYMLRL